MPFGSILREKTVMKPVSIFFAAILMSMASAAAASDGNLSEAPEIASPYRVFEGILSQLGEHEAVINNVPLPLKLAADIVLKGFAANDYVSFCLDENDMLVSMFHLNRPQGFNQQRFFTRAMLTAPRGEQTIPQAAPVAGERSAPGNNSAPIKQENGVWTN
jgi:hypothetical protein